MSTGGRKKAATLRGAFVVLGIAAWCIWYGLPHPADGVVPHGPFLVPRSLILSTIPPGPARPAFSLPQFIISDRG